MSKVLSRDEILASDDLKPTLTAVEVPEWGGTLHVRMMTGAERDALEGLYVKDKYDNYRAAVAVACVCDEAGKSIFQAGDVMLLGAKAAGPLGRIFDVAMEVNKFNEQHVEASRKKSEASPGDVSS
jgi:hypothetical protein